MRRQAQLAQRHGKTKTQTYKTSSNQKTIHNSARAKVMTASVTRFIVKDLRPYSVVENEGFQDTIKTLEICTIPSWQHFTDKCVPQLYNKVKEQLFNTERVGITTDAWTSCATGYDVTITAHHISPGWELRSHVLQTSVFNGSHTSKNIGALLKEVCTDWNIAHKEPALAWPWPHRKPFKWTLLQGYWEERGRWSGFCIAT